MRDVAIAPSLTPPERSRLAELEAIVSHGLETFVEVGNALLRIRAERLYRETHATFDDSCRERWDMRREVADRTIRSAAVAELVNPNGLSGLNEAQARELAPLLDADETLILETWREVREEYGESANAKRVRDLVKRRLARLHRQREFAARRAAVGDVAPLTTHRDAEIRHGDFRDVLSDLVGSVGAIITDPPYALDWISRDGDDFAAAAARMLEPAGTLAVLFGQLTQYQLKPRLDRHLRHRWTAILLLAGPHAGMVPARVRTGWKPLLIYTHHDAPEPEFLMSDVFVSDEAEKDLHPWQQSRGDFEQIIDAFSYPGDLVVDPFLGAGTSAVAALALGRRFIGCDVDAAAIETTRRRLAA